MEKVIIRPEISSILGQHKATRSILEETHMDFTGTIYTPGLAGGTVKVKCLQETPQARAQVQAHYYP